MNTFRRSLLGLSFVCVAAAWAGASSATSAPATGTAVPPMTATQAAVAKAANAKAQAENDLIAKASAAESKSDWAGAEAAMKQLVGMDPGRWDFSQSLANDQFNDGKFTDAVKSYDDAIRGASADTADAAAAKQALAALYTNQANAYLKLKNSSAASADFTKAAALGGGSADAATSFYNLCATAYNAHKDKEALADCDKAIAADPKMADAWFVKGTILVNEGETDAKGNFTVPPGTLEALTTYLKLEPHGKHASGSEVDAAVGHALIRHCVTSAFG